MDNSQDTLAARATQTVSKNQDTTAQFIIKIRKYQKLLSLFPGNKLNDQYS